ncbi:hypothetical protein BN946_scf185042.g27 [Trametes cinnabarina]|uniref:DUF6589 domain-containing protein n=1 Tax=Pycnoporus cinnabarinus TaxID=5643 RepID=A0A060S471_PYCCI|nr:hypothetical protein BN946_scf185042.g27 [Trametes cinnabarina]
MLSQTQLITLCTTLHQYKATAADFVVSLLAAGPAVTSLAAAALNPIASILDMFSREGRTKEAAQKWARETVAEVCRQEILALTRLDAGLQFRAKAANEAKLESFDLSELAMSMHRTSPTLWALLHILLDSDAERQAQRRRKHRAARKKRQVTWMAVGGVAAAAMGGPTTAAAAAATEGATMAEAATAAGGLKMAGGATVATVATAASGGTAAERGAIGETVPTNTSSEVVSASNTVHARTQGLAVSRSVAGFAEIQVREKSGEHGVEIQHASAEQISNEEVLFWGEDLPVDPLGAAALAGEGEGEDEDMYWANADFLVLDADNDLVEATKEELEELELDQWNKILTLSAIDTSIISLSKESHINMEQLGRTLRASHAFDNFDVEDKHAVPTLEKGDDTLLHLTSGTLLRLDHGVMNKDLECVEEVWATSPLNPQLSDHTRAVLKAEEVKWWELLKLHPEEPLGSSTLTRRERFRQWKFLNDLVHYGPEYFWQFAEALGEPETIEQIPLVKSKQVPVEGMDINQSTVQGNADALEDLFRQAGVGDAEETPSRTPIGKHVVLVHGDLGTCERVQSLQDSRSEESTPWRRLQHVVFVMGLFHLKMACANAIWKIFIKPRSAQEDPTSLMAYVTVTSCATPDSTPHFPLLTH